MEGTRKSLEGSINTTRIHEEFSSNVAKRFFGTESQHITQAHVSFQMISSDIDHITTEGKVFVSGTLICVPERVQY
jgi:hypothetical protein